MDDLVQWLRSQLDEDERVAKEAGVRSLQWRLARPLDDAEMGDAHWLSPPELKHAERHDPARVLREIDAKRRLLSEYAEVAANETDNLDEAVEYADGWANGLGIAVRLLALSYADRPGYREEWKP